MNLQRYVWPLVALILVAFSVAGWALSAAAEELAVVASPMNSIEAATFTSGRPPAEAEGPSGATLLRFDGPFEGYLDLDARRINPADFDLIKVRVKADRAAVLRFSLENYPRKGDASYWWALDALRGPLDETDIWIDLRFPEEIKASGDKRAPWREAAQRGERVLSFQGSIKDTGRQAQGADRRIWLGEIRFVKKAVDLEWDQRRASYSWSQGQDLIYTYPLQLTNKLDRPITARLELRPWQTRHARTEAPNKVPLAAGETRTVEAQVILPAAAAAQQAPLYTERFLAIASAEGIDDSEVTVLRSSDPLHLPVTVPLAEDRLQFPLFPRPSELPAEVIAFDEPLARRLAEAHPPEPLIEMARSHGIYNYGDDFKDEQTSAFRQGLIAAAYLHDLTGEPKYLTIAEKLLAALPEIWSKHYEEWRREAVRPIGSGIIARWNEGFHYTLGLGWRLAGTQRSPYQYSYDHNARGGSMSSMIYAFDMLAPKLSEATRRRFIEDFLVPAGIHCRNHYIGDGNQQATADAVALYAGLAGRNWPLVAFACNSEHGLEGVLAWTFTDEGIHVRDKYQTYVMRPVFWMTELLYGRGVDVYARHEDRIRQIIGVGYQDQEFWRFVEQRRLQ